MGEAGTNDTSGLSGSGATALRTGGHYPYYAVLNRERGVTLGDRIRLAGTTCARRRGLLGVTWLEDRGGLWIAPSEAIHTFGMKMPIDVIFLDRALRVRKVVANLAPSRIALCLAAFSVLELGAGAIARSGTQVGDRLLFEPAAASPSETVAPQYLGC